MVIYPPCLAAARQQHIPTHQEYSVLRAYAQFLFYHQLLSWDDIVPELRRVMTSYGLGPIRLQALQDLTLATRHRTYDKDVPLVCPDMLAVPFLRAHCPYMNESYLQTLFPARVCPFMTHLPADLRKTINERATFSFTEQEKHTFFDRQAKNLSHAEYAEYLDLYAIHWLQQNERWLRKNYTDYGPDILDQIPDPDIRERAVAFLKLEPPRLKLEPHS
mgnify:FL=1